MKKSHPSINLTDVKAELIALAEQIETLVGYELIITSGYRSPDHPVERNKARPGTHTTGSALDIAAVGGGTVYELVKAAQAVGVERIGISRSRNFVHIDIDNSRVKSIWTY